MNEFPTHILYKAGYKYVLQSNYTYRLQATLYPLVSSPYVSIEEHGTFGRKLVLSSGYAWDGPSGPAIDTKTFMRASLIHDGLYQLLREEYLPPLYRAAADDELFYVCREDGMSYLRATYAYIAVRAFASHAADPSSGHKARVAP